MIYDEQWPTCLLYHNPKMYDIDVENLMSHIMFSNNIYNFKANETKTKVKISNHKFFKYVSKYIMHKSPNTSTNQFKGISL